MNKLMVEVCVCFAMIGLAVVAGVRVTVARYSACASVQTERRVRLRCGTIRDILLPFGVKICRVDSFAASGTC